MAGLVVNRRARGPYSGQAGFALLIVLWTLVLLALIITALAGSGRVELRIASNLVANARAEAFADGGVFETIFRLNDGSERRWRPEAGEHHLHPPGADVTIAITDEAGKINPNLATPELLAALLRELPAESGASPAGDADHLAAAIADWRDPGTLARPLGAKLPQYLAAGRNYGPPNAPFQTLDELGRVLGMTPAILARLSPHLSLYQLGDPDPRRADPMIRQALIRLAGRPDSPPQAIIGSGLLTVTITATAVTAEGGHFTRHAIIRSGAAFERGYAILRWE